MPLDLPRADNLGVIRDTCHFLAEQRMNSASVSDLAAWTSVLGLAISGRRWKRTRVFHYRDASIDMGLTAKSGRHRVVLTDNGLEMARARSKVHCHGDALNKAEIAVFRRLLLDMRPVARYLAFFMPNGEPPTTCAQLARDGRPTSFMRTGSDEYELRTAWNSTLSLSRVQKRSYAWTLFGWLRSLNLLDDIYCERPASFLSREREVRILYPIRNATIDLTQFRHLIDS